MGNNVRSFSEIYDSIYKDPKKSGETILCEMKKSAEELRKAFSNELGHPDYEHVQIGEIVPGTLIVFFIDIRGFTKMAIALDNKELIQILQAITAATIVYVKQFDGHVAEFTGDGVMAYFGGVAPVTSAVAIKSLMAAASMMQGIKETVNKYLNRAIDETVRVGMGLEYGNVLWTRIGISDISQPKPVSEVSFVAGKNSAHAKPWEIIVGKNLAEWIPEEYKEKYEPYSFQKDKKDYDYARYALKWERFNSDNNNSPFDLERKLLTKSLPALPIATVSGGGGASSSIHLSTPAIKTTPRPLKDRPMF